MTLPKPYYQDDYSKFLQSKRLFRCWKRRTATTLDSGGAKFFSGELQDRIF